MRMSELVSVRLVVNGEAHEGEVQSRLRLGDFLRHEIQDRRLTIGCFPWKFRGGETASCRVVAFVED